MKIFDLVENQNDQEIPFNVVEDLAIFMRNDPMFYRKHYFPMMAKISDMHERGENIDPIVLMKPTIDLGVDRYCKKFKLGSKSDKIFKKEDKHEAIRKIYSEEMPYVKKGTYKADK